MKKFVKCFSLIIVLLGASLLLFACGGIFDKPHNKLEKAFDELRDSYAVSSTLTVENNEYDRAYQLLSNFSLTTELKVIDTDEEQTALLVNPSFNGSMYHSKGLEIPPWTDNISERTLQSFLEEYGNEVLLDILQSYISKNSFSWTWDKNHNIYQLYVGNADIDTLTSIYNPQSETGNLYITVLQDRKTENIAKIEFDMYYNIHFYFDAIHHINLRLTIDVLALNEDVSITIPNNIKKLVDDYKSLYKVTFFTSPQFIAANEYYQKLILRGAEGEAIYITPYWINGYEFAGWYRNGVLFSKSSSYIIMPNFDIHLEARYRSIY